MRRFIILFTILFVSTFANASHQYLSFTNGYVDSTKFNVTRTITRYDSHIEVKYDIEGGYVYEKVYGNQTYSLVTLGNAGLTNQKGEPELPIYSDMFIVDSKDVTIEVTKSSYEDFKGFFISPGSGYATLGEENVTTPNQSSDVYKQNSFFPEKNIFIKGRFQYRDIPYVNVLFAPIQFNPVTRSIRCYKSITYKIACDNSWRSSNCNSKDFKTLSNLVEDYDIIDRTASDIASKKAAPAPAQKNILKEKADYLIVTVDSLMPAVERFVQWKSQLGFKCKVLSNTNWDNASFLKNAINSAYKTDKPTYLLIVGGYKHVTSNDMAMWEKRYVSDLPYATLGTDNFLIPDMIPGRLTVSTLEEANLVVDKIINYEKNPVEEKSFYNTATHVTNVEDKDLDTISIPHPNGYEDGRFLCTSEEIRDYMQGWGKTVRRMYNYSVNKPTNYNLSVYSDGSAIPDELLNADVWGVTSEDIADELSKGQFYVLYNAHGNVRIWGSKDDDYFTSDHAKDLTNGNRLPVVFSISCLTGRFNVNSCIAESFLTARKGGAVGVVASSETSTFLWNDLFAEGIFNTMYPEPGINGKWGSIQSPGWKVVEYEKEPQPEYRMGRVMRNGLFRMFKMLPSTDSLCAKHTCEEYHYFGDPSMEIYTNVPQCIHPTIIQDGSVVTVSTGIESGCRIVLTSSMDYGQSYMAVAEDVSSAVFENVDFPYIVTITKHNYKPYISGLKSAYIQNRVITKDGELRADTIYAGSEVTDTVDHNNVVVKDGKLTLVAKEKIYLKKGFSTNGGRMLAHVEDYYRCNFGNTPPPLYHPELPDNAVSTDVTEVQSSSNNAIWAERGNIALKFDTPKNVVVTDLLGRVVYEKSNMVEGYVHLANGVYIVLCENQAVKVIVKD